MWGVRNWPGYKEAERLTFFKNKIVLATSYLEIWYEN